MFPPPAAGRTLTKVMTESSHAPPPKREPRPSGPGVLHHLANAIAERRHRLVMLTRVRDEEWSGR